MCESALSAVKQPCFPGDPRPAQTLGHELSFDELGLDKEGSSSPSDEVVCSRKGGWELIGALSSGIGMQSWFR